MKFRTAISILLTLPVLSCSSDIADTTGSVVGTVKDSRNDAYMAGVNVTLTPVNETNVSGQRSVSTSSDGSFRFDDLIPNSFKVTAIKEGYNSTERTVKVVAGGAENVDLVMTPSSPELKLSHNTLDFGVDATTLPFDITNSGDAALEWSVSEDISWLSCLPTSGKLRPKEKVSVVVNVSREGLDRGNYSQTLVVSSNGGSETLRINMVIQGISIIVSPDQLDFGSTNTSMSVSLKNAGSGNAPYTLSTTNTWIKLSKTTGTLSPSATEQIAISVDRSGMAEGDYNGTISLVSGDYNLEIPVKMNIPSKEKPTVYLSSISDVSFSGATFKGGIVSIGSAGVFRHGFCWGTGESPNIDNSKTCNFGNSETAKDFTYKVSDLDANTTYYVRAYAENKEGISYSNCEKFITNGVPTTPTVSTGAVSDIQSNQAIAQGIISGMGNLESVAQHGHVWSTKPNPTVNDQITKLGETYSTGSFVSTLTGLKPNATYHVRAYATNSKGTSYGDDVTFTTTFGTVNLHTDEATEITSKSAKVGGTIKDKGGYSISERGVCWARTSRPTTAENHLAISTSSDSFSTTISKLSSCTTYYARAYVKTSAGDTFYGNEVTFTTPSKEVDLNRDEFDNESNWSR